MQIDPVQEWQRLTAEYRQKGDQELRELAADYADLTQTAQQALQQEMRSRGLGDPQAANLADQNAEAAFHETRAPISGEEPAFQLPDSIMARAPKIVADAALADQEDAGPHDYTWKTVLCECDTTDQAWALSAALKSAGIDSWVQDSREFGLRYSRVLVAADQLDQARVIAAQPIPQEIVNESKREIPDFVEPKCPKCGSDDVVLESVDPENTWRCEQCDAQWTDAFPETAKESSQP